jgi:L-aminopeptidase/D-esterase-like protein
MTDFTGVHDDIADVPGLRVGHAQDGNAKTGVTVVLPPPGGCSAGVHVGGNASSTRQMDSLGPKHLIGRVDGVCFCGGSAFGLDAVGGVLACLERDNIGIPVTGRTIPIVPSAAVFDLNFGDPSVRPDWEMGFEACEKAASGPVPQGSVGAGTGATVGKLRGIDHAMKGGLGSASRRSGDLVVGALVVVNAYGDIFDPDGSILAGVRRSPESMTLANGAELLREGETVSTNISVENTTLAVVAVNAALDKITASRIASQATLGLGRVISPFHTRIDGDLTIVMGLGDRVEDPSRIGLLAGDALQKAVIRAVEHADGFGILPARRDMVSGTTWSRRERLQA